MKTNVLAGMIKSSDIPYEELCILIDQHVKEFTVSFTDWLDDLPLTERISVWSKDGSGKGLYAMDSEQLLEKYKRQLNKKL